MAILQHLKQILIKIATAFLMSICFTHLYQYITGIANTSGWLVYVAGISLGAVYFFLLHQVYRFVKKSFNIRFTKQRLPAKLYVLSVLAFIFAGLLLLWGIRSVSTVVFSLGANPLIESQVRLLYIAVAIVLFLYYVFLTFLQLSEDVQRMSVQAEKLQRERAQAQINTLKNQISPHFLFNTFNTLSSLIYIEEDETTIQFIQELKKVFHYILENKHKELVDLKTELDFVQAYFYLLKIRFRESIQWELALTEQEYGYYIPPLTLQMLLENAVKHNIFSKSAPLYINVRAEGKHLRISNNRNERKLSEGESMGIGLQNIRNRYQLVCPEQVEIYCDDENYTVKIPLLHHA